VFDRAARHFAAIPAGVPPAMAAVSEPSQQAERRVVVSRQGGTSYLKMAYHAPAVGDADFFPMLVLDAVLTGAKGLSLWASFRTPPPQRTTRLYRALVDRGLASGVQGLLIATADPFLYIVSATVNDGVSLTDAEAALTAELDRVRGGAIADGEVDVARKQLRTRLVFDADSVTNLAHQLGYFETIASWRLLGELLPRIEAVTPADVRRVAATRLDPSRRTVGWFDPAPDPATVARGEGA
jgi:zinc protease